MKKKFLTGLGCLALAVVGAFGLVGCGEQPTSPVSFGQVKGNYRGAEVTIAATKWTKQANEEGIDGVWKLNENQTIAWNADAKEVFGTDSGNIIAITISTKGHDASTMNIYKDSLKTPEQEEKDELEIETGTNKGDNFIYFTTINKQSKGFVLKFDWDGDEEPDTVYKFVIPGDAETLTFDPAPQA